MTTEYESKMRATKIIKGNLDMILTGLSLENGELYGYEAMQKIRKRFGTSMGPSTIYPQLDKMAKDGYFTTEWGMGGNKRPIKVYKPTRKAREANAEYKAGMTTLMGILGSDVELGMIVNSESIPIVQPSAPMAKKV
jgi:DNA-binding PadR family transcriptional regulator